MNKKAIIIVFCVLLIGAGAFLYFRDGKQGPESSPKPIALTYDEFEKIVTTLVSQDDLQGVRIQEIYDDPHTRVISPSGKKQIFIIDLPELSGTGGVGGVVIAIDSATKKGLFLGDHMGGGSELIFSPKETYFVMHEASKNGPTCINSYNAIFYTETEDTSPVVLRPDLTVSSSDDYVETSNPHWIDDQNVQFTAAVSYCDFASPSTSKSNSSLWQYNVITKQYKQIN